MKVLEAFGEPIADGGQEAFVFGVIDKIDMSNLQIDCLTAYDCRSDRYRKTVEEKGGRVYSLELPFSPGKSRRNIRRPLAEFLMKHHYDIIHIHSGSISVLVIMAEGAKKAGVKKVIVHSHATGENDNLKHKILRYLASLSMRKNVDIYCACSKEAASWKFEKEYANKALIIKNGIDIKRFSFDPEKRSKVRERYHIQDHFVIGHVGRFSREKNHIFLIRVLEEVYKRDKSATLLLVGDGDEIANIKKLVTEKNLDHRTIFAGSVINVEDYLQAMDVFVFPSIYEGMAISLLEAIATGLPVIVSEGVPSIDSLEKIVTRLPLKDIEKWADAIIKYQYRERTGLEEMSIISGFDVSFTASTIRELYFSK